MTSRNDANKLCTAWLYLHETEDCGNKWWNLSWTPRAFSPWIMMMMKLVTQLRSRSLSIHHWKRAVVVFLEPVWGVLYLYNLPIYFCVLLFSLFEFVHFESKLYASFQVTPIGFSDFCVRNIGQAIVGRKEIELAEQGELLLLWN